MEIKIIPSTMEAGDNLLFGGRLYRYVPNKNGAGPYRFRCRDYGMSNVTESQTESGQESFIEKVFDYDEVCDLIRAGNIYRPFLVQCCLDSELKASPVETIVQDGEPATLLNINSEKELPGSLQEFLSEKFSKS